MIRFTADFVGFIHPTNREKAELTTWPDRKTMGGLCCSFKIKAQEMYYNERGQSQETSVTYPTIKCWDASLTSKVLALFEKGAHVEVIVDSYRNVKSTFDGKYYPEMNLASIEAFTPESSATPQEMAVLAGVTA